MNPNSQDKNQEIIDKNRSDTEAQIFEILNKILRKSRQELTKDDLGFLQARRSYLTRGQTEEYKEELAIDLQAVDKAELTRAELEAQALVMGIEDPSVKIYKTKNDLITAMKAVS